MLPLSACNIGGRGGARLGHLCDRCSNDLRAEDSFPSAGYEALKKSSINDASRRPISRRRSEERGGGLLFGKNDNAVEGEKGYL